MPILNIQSSQTGLVGTLPSIAYINTSDTEAQILVTGYLNQSVQSGLAAFTLPCMACVSTLTAPGAQQDVGWYEVQYTTTAGSPHSGIWSLVPGVNPGNVTLPTVAGDFAIFSNADGGLEDLGYLPSNPTLTRVVMESGASVVGDIPQYNDVTGTIKDSGITAASISALLAGSGGGSIRSATVSGSFPTATTVITDPAITAASVVIAAFVSSANVVSIQTVLPASGQFTINTDTAPSTAVLEYISFIPSASLVTAGVVAGKTSFSSGPATFVMSAPGITPGMVVVANFQSQGTPSRIYTALPGTDQITFVVSSGPGVSVMEWVGMLPGDITPLGLHAADFSNPGGAASVVISDPEITASSIVVANFKSEAGANYIQKVTPSAGTLTVLVNADPGVSVIAYMATAAAGGGGSGNLTNALPSGDILVGNSLNIATPVAMSGAGTLSNTGVLTLTQLPQLYEVSVTFNTAAMVTAFDTPLTIVANPLASQMILVVQAAVYTASTGNTAYATGTAPIIQYSTGGTNGAHGAGTIATAAGLVAGDITAATSQVRNLFGIATGALTALSGKGLYFSNATGDYTGGTGTNITVTVLYQLLTATV